MHRLKEPIRNKGSQEDQDIIINVLAKAATSDSSPVIRLEAIGALGRFEDPRAVDILIYAYMNAHGRKGVESPPVPRPTVVQASGLSAGRAPTSLAINGFDTGLLRRTVCLRFRNKGPVGLLETKAIGDVLCHWLNLNANPTTRP